METKQREQLKSYYILFLIFIGIPGFLIYRGCNSGGKKEVAANNYKYEDGIIGKWYDSESEYYYILSNRSGRFYLKEILHDDSGEKLMDTMNIDMEVRYYNPNRDYTYFTWDSIGNKFLYSNAYKEGYMFQQKNGDYFIIDGYNQLVFCDKDKRGFKLAKQVKTTS